MADLDGRRLTMGPIEPGRPVTGKVVVVSAGLLVTMGMIRSVGHSGFFRLEYLDKSDERIKSFIFMQCQIMEFEQTIS